jgi:hypothetical protein
MPSERDRKMKDFLIIAGVGVAVWFLFGQSAAPATVTTSGTAPAPTNTTNAGNTSNAAATAGTATNVAPNRGSGQTRVVATLPNRNPVKTGHTYYPLLGGGAPLIGPGINF